MSRPTLRDLMNSRTGGRLAGKSINSAIENFRNRRNEPGAFETAIVSEVISNPASFLSRPYGEPEDSLTMRDALLDLSSTKGVTNPSMVDLAPRNSILAYNISAADSEGKQRPELFFPFFPAHIAFPAKPGEHVWIFYDNVGGNDIGYWLFRKPSYRQVDDVNYTAAEREIPVAALQSANESSGKELSELDRDELLIETLMFPDNPALKIKNAQIANDSIAYREEFIGEPVPRYSKKCGDLVLQGSNNTLIALGTDRSYNRDNISEFTDIESDLGVASYTSDFDTIQNQDGTTRVYKPELAGCIDLVVGRGVLDLKSNALFNDASLMNVSLKALGTSYTDLQKSGLQSAIDKLMGTFQVVKNARDEDAESLSYYETVKSSAFMGDISTESPDEGDFESSADCEARFYVSMRSSAGNSWQSMLESATGNQPEITGILNKFYGIGKSVISSTAYSIKNYARGHCDLQAAGASVYVGGSVILASSGGAYIHLKPNGDISIVPGTGGVIKLGAENASLAMLGSDAVSGATALQALEGNATTMADLGYSTSEEDPYGESLNINYPTGINGLPITSTAGGTVGIAEMLEQMQSTTSAQPPNGKFAKRILMA